MPWLTACGVDGVDLGVGIGELKHPEWVGVLGLGLEPLGFEGTPGR